MPSKIGAGSKIRVLNAKIGVAFFFSKISTKIIGTRLLCILQTYTRQEVING